VRDHPQLRFQSEIARCQAQVKRLSFIANQAAHIANHAAQFESIEKAQADQTSSGAKGYRASAHPELSEPRVPGSAGH
jgi:hypothetical protein